MIDVYDGDIWKEFINPSDPKTLKTIALMMNVDWFRPCKHLTYSVSVLYFAIMNFPHEYRFKRENILPIGIIPGPQEPKHDMNSLLEALVQELLHFKDGLPMSVNLSTQEVTIRCLLSCVACDLPAVTKLCGYLSYSAKIGCSKCYKEYSCDVGARDYSGFDGSLWCKRIIDDHRQHIK